MSNVIAVNELAEKHRIPLLDTWWHLLEYFQKYISSTSILFLHNQRYFNWHFMKLSFCSGLEQEPELSRLIHNINIATIYDAIMLNGFTIRVDNPFSLGFEDCHDYNDAEEEAYKEGPYHAGFFPFCFHYGW